MSTVSMRVAKEYDAALALLDLQSNIRGSRNERYGATESVEAAQLLLSCFMASNVTQQQQPIKETKTRDVGTQTEEKNPVPTIATMELSISQLSEKIKSLEEQFHSNSQQGNRQWRYHYDNDDDESYKVNSHELSTDDSDACDKEMVETFTDCETPEKVTTENRAGHYNVLSNRNIKANADDLVPIGDGNALIPSRIFRHVNWNSYTSATRKLLMAVFTRRILATHSLTGKPSPAFPNKSAKKKLDPALVRDIVQTVVERCCVPENVVRTIITTKCADESKMFRTRENIKNKREHTVDKKSIPPESRLRLKYNEKV